MDKKMKIEISLPPMLRKVDNRKIVKYQEEGYDTEYMNIEEFLIFSCRKFLGSNVTVRYDNENKERFVVKMLNDK